MADVQGIKTSAHDINDMPKWFRKQMRLRYEVRIYARQVQSIPQPTPCIDRQLPVRIWL